MDDLGYIKSRGSHGFSLHGGRRNRFNPFNIIIIIAVIALIAVFGFIIFRFRGKIKPGIKNIPTATESNHINDETDESSSAPEETESTETDSAKSEILDSANRLALQYDYDAAIEMLKSSDFSEDADIQAAISSYESTKAGLVRQDINKISHVFFHTLIVDKSKAFDGDRKEMGYNQVMTTVDEFNLILENLYAKGFVLVGLHDIAYETDSEDGSGKVMKAGDIMLPEGKQAIVISQDDVCYYEYMVGDGFASRIVIDENSKPVCEMDLEDGSTVTGSYDLIPILNDFIEAHPDFSYKGAKAIIAVTGYNGVFGYRTDSAYSDNPTFEEDKAQAAKVAEALRNDGWELASHSWGHRYMGRISYEDFKTDCDKWQSEVESIIGETDIILYPFGADVSDWHPYTDDNQRYMYMHNQGFRYFCTVDSAQYWVQLGHDFFRQGRRNLDGYRMWRDINEPDNKKLSDLFEASEVFDKDRPTPIDALN